MTSHHKVQTDGSTSGQGKNSSSSEKSSEKESKVKAERLELQTGLRAVPQASACGQELYL
eukprot:1160445-Pelagomonas_calceolata.AAC.5